MSHGFHKLWLKVTAIITGSFGPVFFRPDVLAASSALLCLKNNLTLFACTLLQGQGASGRVDLVEASAGGDSVWRIDASVLPAAASRQAPTFQRSFLFHNSGALPLAVSSLGFSRQGTLCAEGAFQILTCDSFVLAPGQQIRLDIKRAALHIPFQLLPQPPSSPCHSPPSPPSMARRLHRTGRTRGDAF